jgi:hypothetical protein
MQDGQVYMHKCNFMCVAAGAVTGGTQGRDMSVFDKPLCVYTASHVDVLREQQRNVTALVTVAASPIKK